MAVGLVWDERYLAHEAPGHPECPARLTAIRQALKAADLWDRLVPIPPYPAGEEVLRRVHTPQHIRRIFETSRSAAVTWLDGDTYACAASAEAARLAAGGVCAAVDAVLEQEVAGAFCAVRPPGHHAGRDRAMGFCLFNNVAVAACHALSAAGIGRVLVVDWDVHHGNGTQDIFCRDPRVMYLSLHQWPLYPGTGRAEEIGEGEGMGLTCNRPLPPGTGDEVFLAALQEGLEGAEGFAPQFVLISCGFDGLREDPLGGWALTAEGFAEATRRVCRLAERTAAGRLVSVLEGGYDLEALGRSAAAHVKALLEHR